jgi:hypothetical protein
MALMGCPQVGSAVGRERRLPWLIFDVDAVDSDELVDGPDAVGAR